jgi:two-component sensor histidine kinase
MEASSSGKRSAGADQRAAMAAVRVLEWSSRLRQHAAFGYAMAFVLVGLATGLEWLAQDQYAGAPFLTIYPAVMLTTFVGGLGAGLLSAVLAGASEWGLFIPILRWGALASYAIDATVCVLLIVLINRSTDLLLASIDRAKEEKQRQYLVATELHHRIQNLFAVIQAVIQFSLPREGPVDSALIKQRLMDRLQSMSVANRAITDSLGGGVRLSDLVAAEVSGFEQRFDLAGAADVALAPQMTQNLSLVLHELLTNALKYGALSVPHGRIRLERRWASPQLTLTWQERGGPPASEPATVGFGSHILGRFARSFCQDVDLRYGQDGLYYQITIRSDQIWQERFSPSPRARGEGRGEGASPQV